MNILITGGAGYIGSHVLKQLLETTTHTIVVIDNLSTGQQQTIDILQNIRLFEFLKLDLGDFESVKTLFKNYDIEVVLHFAASIVVPESVSNPLKYYMNNTVNTTYLIDIAVKANVNKFVFSSTAAVYGEPTEIPLEGVSEIFPTNPINPYGMSKLMSEQILCDVAKAYPSFRYIIFRYFNVAGADSVSTIPLIGQSLPDATHLIKVATECAIGKREKILIFGDDYETYDGTGVRDYIHVDDLARAHIDAIDYLKHHESDIFNIGYGVGYSVKKIIRTIEKISGKQLIVEVVPRRQGDPAQLIADNRKIIQKMKWNPQYADLECICKSVLKWEEKSINA